MSYNWWQYDPNTNTVSREHDLHRALLEEPPYFGPDIAIPGTVYRRLLSSGFRTLAEVQRCPDIELLKCGNIGKITLAKIRQVAPYIPPSANAKAASDFASELQGLDMVSISCALKEIAHGLKWLADSLLPMPRAEGDNDDDEYN